MPRPREFDEEAALEAAMDVFWKRGYQATSVRDLADAMGISAPSLYNVYGDKRTLFARALERYIDHLTRARNSFEDSVRPKQAVRLFIEDIIERSAKDRDRRGCLLINSALEVAPHDKKLGAVIHDGVDNFEAFFRRSIEAAQAEGTIPPDRVAKDLARLLLGVLISIRILARTRPQRELLTSLARPALALLD